jgi:anthranilate synthase/aminodeoxychorismate synthase-like glutamine amidotransferase
MPAVFIDNYDSFSYILIDYFKQAGLEDIVIYRNDAITVEGVLAQNPSAIIISPGPSSPDESGICLDLIKTIIDRNIRIPLLGVCLGHQAIIQASGGKIVRTKPIHGKQDLITHDGNSTLFANIPAEFKVARYHSLVGVAVHGDLQVTGVTRDCEIMAVEHKSLPIFGVQFHPESIVTEYGIEIIKNFISRIIGA